MIRRRERPFARRGRAAAYLSHSESTMSLRQPSSTMRRVLLRCAIACALASPALAAAQDAAALRARHDTLRSSLASSPFQRPLLLESSEAADELKGEVYAVVAHPFAAASAALQGGEQWCELLTLHLNVKRCTVSGKAPAETLGLVMGSKFDAAGDDAYRVDFACRVALASRDYLRVQLDAPSGPMNTRDYRLMLEATALDGTRSFIHLSYAYAYGTTAKLATQAYLSTLGRSKVGFSVVDRGKDGEPVRVKGVRGVAERNTMRYFLAIEAHLAALALPPAERRDKRLRDWFDATERYPQLREMTRDEYLAMKAGVSR